MKVDLFPAVDAFHREELRRAVIETQRGRLDRAYLERWGTELGVADLLERLLDGPSSTG